MKYTRSICVIAAVLFLIPGGTAPVAAEGRELSVPAADVSERDEGASSTPGDSAQHRRAVTAGGRTVILYPDGTWEYAPGEAPGADLPGDSIFEGRSMEAEVLVTAVVTGIKDGDTFDVVIESGLVGFQKQETVRLLGVDAPETKRKEFYADEAKRYTRDRLLGRRIYLRFDDASRDSFCRLLAYVYLEDGACFNVELLSGGYARLFTGYTCGLYESLRRIQDGALADRTGLWGRKPGRIAILYIYNHGTKEHVVIANNTSGRVELSGWVLKDRHDNELSMPEGASIDAGGFVKIYSGDGGIHDPPRSYYLASHTIWGNRGDCAYLYDDRGELIDTHEYR